MLEQKNKSEEYFQSYRFRVLEEIESHSFSHDMVVRMLDALKGNVAFVKSCCQVFRLCKSAFQLLT